MVVKLEPVEFPDVARLVYAQDDGLQEAVEAAEDLCRRGFLEIPRPDGMFDGLEQGVFADPLRAAEDEGVIYLVLWPLHAVSEPIQDMVGLGWEHVCDVLDPLAGFAGI